MSVSDDILTLTITAKGIPELRFKLKEHLRALGEDIEHEEQNDYDDLDEIEFPDHIKNLLPDHRWSEHSAAMLTVLHEKFKGKGNAVNSWDLAEEMKLRFPKFFFRKSIKKISWGNIFPGTKLAKAGLIQIEKDEEKRRIYWVQ